MSFSMDTVIPQDFRDIIDLWPSAAYLAGEIGASPGLVASWKHRNSIPPKWWEKIERAALRRGIDGVSWNVLNALHRSRFPVRGGRHP